MRTVAIIAACTAAFAVSLWRSNQSAPPARLVYQNVGVTDSTFPAAIAVKFENTGEGQPEIQGVEGRCHNYFVISGPADPTLIPKQFDCKLDVANVETPGVVHALLQWTADDLPMDLLAVVGMSFVIKHGGEGKLTTDPMTFMIANSPQGQTAIAKGEFHFEEDYGELAEQIESLPGYKSRSVERLLENLRRPTRQP